MHKIEISEHLIFPRYKKYVMHYKLHATLLLQNI